MGSEMIIPGLFEPSVRILRVTHFGNSEPPYQALVTYISLYTVCTHLWCEYSIKEVAIMTKYHEILCLKSLGFSERNIAQSCGVSRNTVARGLKKQRK